MRFKPTCLFLFWLHMRFDDNGMIAEVKTWLDTLTLEKVLGEERARQQTEGNWCEWGEISECYGRYEEKL